MDAIKLNTLAGRFKRTTDPRCRRGVRHQWWVILTIIACGLLCGQRNFRAIHQWACCHRALLRQYLPLWNGCVPSAKTLQRAMNRLDLKAFMAQADEFISSTRQPDGSAPPAISMDGKAVRGASHGGRKVHLLTLASHADGAVLGRLNVGLKENEIGVAPQLLAGRNLQGQWISGDAMFCQRGLSRLVVDGGGDYLWEVKDNQPSLMADLVCLFTSPRGGPHPVAFWSETTLDSGHGRIEERFLEASEALNDYLDWPGLQQVVSRTCTRHIKGETTVEQHFYITSRSHEAASAKQLLEATRGHWGIENQVNRARDVIFGEDASTYRTGTGPEAMSVMRDLVIHLLHRSSGFALSEKLRYYQAYPAKALVALGLRRL